MVLCRQVAVQSEQKDPQLLCLSRQRIGRYQDIRWPCGIVHTLKLSKPSLSKQGGCSHHVN